MPGITVVEGIGFHVEDSQKKGEEELVGIVFTQQFIYLIHNIFGISGKSVALDKGMGYTHEQCGRDTSTGDIANGYQHFMVADHKEVEEVAADSQKGFIHGMDGEAGIMQVVVSSGRDEASLDFGSQLNVGPEACPTQAQFFFALKVSFVLFLEAYQTFLEHDGFIIHAWPEIQFFDAEIVELPADFGNRLHESPGNGKDQEKDQRGDYCGNQNHTQKKPIEVPVEHGIGHYKGNDPVVFRDKRWIGP